MARFCSFYGYLSWRFSRITNRSGLLEKLGLSQMIASALSLSASEVLYVSFQSRVCLLRPLSLPCANSTGIQCRMFGGFLLGQGPWAASDPLLLRGSLYNCDYPPLCGSPPRWCEPWLYHISDPIIHLCGSFFTSLCFLSSFYLSNNGHIYIVYLFH